MTQTAIRILVVDDHSIVRKGTRALLDRIPDFTVVGEAGNGVEAVAQAKALQPDVILMDLMMPEMDGIEAISHITASQPNSRILALTSFAADDKVFPAIKAGALGYMLKDADPEDFDTGYSPGSPWRTIAAPKYCPQSSARIKPPTNAPLPRPLTH